MRLLDQIGSVVAALFAASILHVVALGAVGYIGWLIYLERVQLVGSVTKKLGELQFMSDAHPKLRRRLWRWYGTWYTFSRLGAEDGMWSAMAKLSQERSLVGGVCLFLVAKRQELKALVSRGKGAKTTVKVERFISERKQTRLATINVLDSTRL